MLFRREIAFAGAYRKPAVETEKIDRSKGSVGSEVRGLVDQRILAAQLVFNVLEVQRDIFEARGEEGAAAGGFRDLLQRVVATVAAGADIGADGVHDGLGALTLLDRVIQIRMALVVVAIGDKDHGTAHRFALAREVE